MTLFLNLSSCSNKSITNDDIDKFVSKYKDYNFSKFKGVSISYRGSDRGEHIYMVAKQGGGSPPYVVHINNRNKKVTNIDDKLLKQRDHENYFSESQIEALMSIFISLDVLNLSVDNNENVFISPFYSDTPISFLRLNVKTGDSIVKKGYVYELYKDNWYINKTK